MKKYDYAIIGSGVGTLTAGAILARQGKTVFLAEKHYQVGGYATEFSRKGYTFDVSLHQIGGVRKYGLHKILKAAGVYDNLEFFKHKYLSELEFPSGEKIAIPNGDGDLHEQQLIAHFPEDKRAIKHWFKVMRQYGKQAELSSKRTDSPFHQAVIDLFSPLLIPRLIHGSVTKLPIEKELHVKSNELKSILTHFSGYYGLRSSEVNTLFPMIANFGYYYCGGYYIKGGASKLANELAKVITNNGGNVQTNCEVSKVIVDNGRAASMIVGNDRNEIFADNFVVGSSPHHLYGSLLTDWDGAQEQLNKISPNEISMTASVLYVALDCPIGELNEDLKDAYEYSFLSPLNEEEFYNLFENNSGFDNDYSNWPLTLSIHSTIDPSCLPESGGTCFDIFITDNCERWDKLSPEEYRIQKEIEREKLIDHIEKRIPGVRDHIVVAEMGTPKTMERYTGNPKGALYGFSQNCEQTMFSRMKPQSAIPNIKFASAWTQPGGGFEGSMGSGLRLTQKSYISGYIILTIMVIFMSFGWILF